MQGPASGSLANRRIPRPSALDRAGDYRAHNYLEKLRLSIDTRLGMTYPTAQIALVTYFLCTLRLKPTALTDNAGHIHIYIYIHIMYTIMYTAHTHTDTIWS